MAQGSGEHRKMTRRIRPTSSGMHDVVMSPDGLANNDARSKQYADELKAGAKGKPVHPVIRRAAKKQIKTREEKSWRAQQSQENDQDQHGQ